VAVEMFFQAAAPDVFKNEVKPSIGLACPIQVHDIRVPNPRSTSSKASEIGTIEAAVVGFSDELSSSAPSTGELAPRFTSSGRSP
jgi:hypothetical protein